MKITCFFFTEGIESWFSYNINFKIFKNNILCTSVTSVVTDQKTVCNQGN